MKYLFFAFLVMLANNVLHAQSNKVTIGKIDTVYSKILGEQRQVWVYTPDMLSGDHDKSRRYPVVYLLDGDGHFPSLVGMIQQLSEVNGNNICPEMIVVGIPNTDRTRDLTPVHVDADPPMMDSNFSRTSGGGENFVAFIEKELMPHIDSVYPTQPYKMLVGHSFGGLTVMNVLTNHTKLFNAYIAIDPSMWYNKEKFLKETEEKLASQKYDGVRLYLGIANTMPPGMTLDKMKKDTSSGTRHIRSIFETDQFIKSHPQNGLLFASKYYGDDDHGSVPLISEYDGLRFIFSFYRMKMYPSDFADSASKLADKLKQHYEEVSKQFGYSVMPPEMQVNSLGYFAMSSKQYKKANDLFKLNVDNYPKSENAYDSYGDYFAAIKDTANAIAWYQKALTIQDNPDTKLKLAQMQGATALAPATADLQQYVGEYIFDDINLTVTLSIKDNALWASVPNEGDFQLVPVALNIFGVKNMDGYKVTFNTDGNKVTGLTSEQPNGTYKAKLKQ